MVQQCVRRFVAACLFGMVALCMSVGIALAADQSSDVSNTKVYTGSIQLLSRGLNGAVSNGASGGGYISASGSCLVFSSQASNLVEGDSNGVGDMFFAPINNGVVGKLEILIPVTTRSFPRGISDDCNTILFMRDDPGNLTNLYVLDRPSGNVTLISRGTDGSGVGKVDSSYMTPNGQFVYFTSTSDKIISPDTNGAARDAFEFEVSTGSIFLVSRTSDGQQVSGVPYAYDSTYPVTGSDDGNIAFFVATDQKLPDHGSYGNEEIYAFNRATGQTASLTAGLPEHMGSGNTSYEVNYGEMVVADGGKVFFAGNKYSVYRYDISNGARDELPKFRSFNTWHVSRDGSTFAFNYGSLGSSYSCLQNVLTSASECLHEPLYDSQYVIKEISSLSGDGTKVLFGAQNLGWVNIANNRNVFESYFWNRAADYSISGTVVDEGGKNLNGTMKYSGGPFPEVRSVTFSGGVYTITNLITGTYTITPVVSGKTFNPPSQTVNVPTTKKVNFPPAMPTPLPTFDISGKVNEWTVDGSPKPLQGVTITAYGQQDYTVQTDANGGYSLKVPTGQYAVHAEVGGHLVYYQIDTDGDNLVENKENQELSVTSNIDLSDFLAIPCVSPITKLNVCELKKGDILLKDTPSVFDIEVGIMTSYFSHAALFSGSGNLVEAAGKFSNPKQDVRNHSIQENGFYINNSVRDWVVLRLKPQYQYLIEGAVDHALMLAKDPNVRFIQSVSGYFKDNNKLQEEEFYCSLLIWRSYYVQPGKMDLDYNRGFLGPINIYANQVLPDDLFSSSLYSILGEEPKTDLVQAKPEMKGFLRILYSMWSPANILVRTSQGQETGFNSSSKAIVNSIAGGFYSGPDSEPEWVRVALTNSTKVEVYGTGVGTYTLAVQAFNEISMTNAVYVGTTFPEKLEVFSVEEDGKGLQISLQSTPPVPTSTPIVPAPTTTPNPTAQSVFLPVVKR